mmetsp:Transcript_19122/g.48575  ORF Transcript_19122/g.48575 Transcript_19122/m.48575 type:complete len:277 (-) Transcript_19122:168-998(-)
MVDTPPSDRQPAVSDSELGPGSHQGEVGVGAAEEPLPPVPPSGWPSGPTSSVCGRWRLVAPVAELQQLLLASVSREEDLCGCRSGLPGLAGVPDPGAPPSGPSRPKPDDTLWPAGGCVLWCAYPARLLAPLGEVDSRLLRAGVDALLPLLISNACMCAAAAAAMATAACGVDTTCSFLRPGEREREAGECDLVWWWCAWAEVCAWLWLRSERLWCVCTRWWGWWWWCLCRPCFSRLSCSARMAPTCWGPCCAMCSAPPCSPLGTDSARDAATSAPP